MHNRDTGPSSISSTHDLSTFISDEYPRFPSFNFKKPDSGYQLAQFSESIISRVEIVGSFVDEVPDRTQLGPSCFI